MVAVPSSNGLVAIVVVASGHLLAFSSRHLQLQGKLVMRVAVSSAGEHT